MLPHDDWLAQAKRLAVGMRVRVKHGRERRLNMVIGNDADKWWSYCQACKEGGVLTKEHVLLNVGTVVKPLSLIVPTDIKPVLGSDYELLISKFLASKHMMYPYLPELYYSEQASRLMIKDSELCWHGRDLTERSSAKWLHYGATMSGKPNYTTVLTEDLFSMWKIRYAFRNESWKPSVVCTLGTAPSKVCVFALRNVEKLIWAYDGDRAGDDGYAFGKHRMQAFNIKQYRARPPEGLDPKDMDCADIRELIRSCNDY